MKPPSLAAAFTVAHASAGLDCADRCMRVALRMYSLPPLTLALAFTLLSPFNTSFAQTYPSKPIRIVVPFTPGGSPDVLARTLGQKISQAWGVAVVVDNKPGGNAAIGTESVARAAPDGTQLAILSDGPDPTKSDVVLQLVNATTGKLTSLNLPETSPLGHQDPAWRPDVAGRRLLMWTAYAPLILSSGDLVFRSKVLNAIARTARQSKLCASTRPAVPAASAAASTAPARAVSE